MKMSITSLPSGKFEFVENLLPQLTFRWGLLCEVSLSGRPFICPDEQSLFATCRRNEAGLSRARGRQKVSKEARMPFD